MVWDRLNNNIKKLSSVVISADRLLLLVTSGHFWSPAGLLDRLLLACFGRSGTMVLQPFQPPTTTNREPPSPAATTTSVASQ